MCSESRVSRYLKDGKCAIVVAKLKKRTTVRMVARIGNMAEFFGQCEIALDSRIDTIVLSMLLRDEYSTGLRGS